MSTVPYDKGDSSGTIFAVDDASANKVPAGACYLVQGGVAVPWTGAVTLTSTTVTGTVAVSAASLPLPSGAATSANQATEIASLASLDAKAPALGQALAAASVPIVLTAAQLTTLAPPAAITGYALDATLSTLSGKVTACNTGAVTISAALPAGTNAIGKLAANSGVTIGAVEIAAAQTLATVTTLTTCSTVTSLTQMNGQAIAMGTGVRSAGTQRVTIATDDVVPVSISSVPSHAVTNAGTFAVQVSSLTQTEKLLTSGTNDTLLSTAATLANNAIAISAALTPTDPNYLFTEVELSATFSVAPTAGTAISVWFLRTTDGTNYEDGDAAPTTPARAPDLVLPLRAVTTAQRVIRQVALPPGSFKCLAKNDGSGQTMGSGWTLKSKPFTRQRT